MANTCCTCWISLVLLVIREAVEKWFSSSPEKDITFRYTPFLRFLPRIAATLADKNVTEMAATIMTSASPSILRPDIRMYRICIWSTSIPCPSYSCCTYCTAACVTMESGISFIFEVIASIIFRSCSFGICENTWNRSASSGSCIFSLICFTWSPPSSKLSTAIMGIPKILFSFSLSSLLISFNL